MTRNTKLTLHVRSSCCSKCVTARILLIMVAWTVVMDLFFFKIIFWGFLPLFDRKQGQRDGCDMQRRSPLGSNQGRCNYVACALTIWLLGRYVGMNHYVVWVQWINSCKQMKKKKTTQTTCLCIGGLPSGLWLPQWLETLLSACQSDVWLVYILY